MHIQPLVVTPVGLDSRVDHPLPKLTRLRIALLQLQRPGPRNVVGRFGVWVIWILAAADQLVVTSVERFDLSQDRLALARWLAEALDRGQQRAKLLAIVAQVVIGDR